MTNKKGFLSFSRFREAEHGVVYGVRVYSIPTGKGRGGSRTAPTCTPYFVLL